MAVAEQRDAVLNNQPWRPRLIPPTARALRRPPRTAGAAAAAAAAAAPSAAVVAPPRAVAIALRKETKRAKLPKPHVKKNSTNSNAMQR